MRIRWILPVLLLLVTSVMAQPEPRTFYMGFTPFPYAVSFEAVDFTYATIGRDADLIAQHFDSGLPWVEALSGAPYPQAVLDDWAFRKSRSPASHKLYLSVTPINFSRTGLASYRAENEDMPLPAPWDTYSFDHPDVITAFNNYCHKIIDYFEPDYFVMGIEVNLLMKLNPDAWPAYLTLHRQVYAQLKADYPDLPIMVTMTGIDLLEGYTDVDHNAQMQAFNDIIDYTDIFALSMYPYMTGYMTYTIPADMYDRLAELTDKPMAVSETGYPAQSFGILVGDNNVRVEMDGTPEKQNEYISLLLNEAQKHHMAFVINFVLRDYDALWEMLGGKEDLTIAWRDTGLYAENGDERPALVTWRDWLLRGVEHPDS